MRRGGAEGVVRMLTRGTGVYIAVMALLSGPLLWFAFDRFAKIAADHRAQRVAIDAFTSWCIDHRGWMPLMALPALIVGIAIMRRPRSVVGSAFLGVGVLLGPYAVALYCFIMLIAPLYQPRPL